MLGRRYKWIVGVVVALLALRLSLPFGLEWYVNRELDRMETLTGRVADVDLSVIDAEYTMKSTLVERRGGEVPEPFLSIERISLDLNWLELLQGELIVDIHAERIDLQFVDGPGESSSQLAAGSDWAKRFDALLPFTIGSFTVEDGAIRLFRTTGESGTTELTAVTDITIEGRNFSNFRKKEKDKLATFDLKGTVQEAAPLNLYAELNPNADPPNITLDASVTDLPLTALNAVFEAYANIDAEAGVADIDVHFEGADGRFEGYVKPIVRNADILVLDEEGSFFGKLWEGILDSAKALIERGDEDCMAAEIPISGELTAVKIGLLPAVFSILKNAFVDALSAGIGSAIRFGDVESSSAENAQPYPEGCEG